MSGRTVTIEIAGEADHFSVAPLRPILSRAAEDGCTHLVLDTSRVRFADSGLLALLARWHGPHRQLTLVNPSPAVQRLTSCMTAASRRNPRRPRLGETAGVSR